MEPEDRYRMLRDESRWNPIRLTPRSQLSIASRRERRGAWFLRGVIAVAAVIVLGVFGVAGLSSLGRHDGPYSVSPGTQGDPLVGAAAELSCPRYQPAARDTGIDGSGRQLLPFEPASALFCVYAPGLTGTPGNPLRAAYSIVDAEQLSALHDELDERFARPKRDQACTADLGPTAYLRFTGPSGASIDVSVELFGCRDATNGTIKDLVESRGHGASTLDYPRGGKLAPSGLSCPTTWPALDRAEGTSTAAPLAVPSFEQAMLCRYAAPAIGQDPTLEAAQWSLDPNAASALRAAIVRSPASPHLYDGRDCAATKTQALGIRIGGTPALEATVVVTGCGPELITSDGVPHRINAEIYAALNHWPGLNPVPSPPASPVG